MANLSLKHKRMRTSFRAAVIVGLLALASIFVRPTHAAVTSKIVITPASGSISADATQAYKVSAVATDGTSVDVTDQSTLSVNDPTGKMNGVAYTPGKAGSWTVQANFQSFTATAEVTVTPGAVKEVVVNPNSDPEPTFIGTNAKFTATVYDAKNNIITSEKVTWTVLGENGTIDSNGIFTPKKVGTGKVQAAVGDVSGAVSVAVSAPAVTNTNTAITNTAPKNTNTAITNTAPATNTNTAAATKTDTDSTCTSLKPWAWVLLLVVFLVVVGVLYALVPVTQVWPAVAALVVAGILAFIQRQYGCGGQTWFAWVVTLGTVALTGAALQMRPKSTPNA